MRKLFFAVAALPLLFTGCLKSDGTTSKLRPVAQGINMYNVVKLQEDVALQPADVGIRLAMLLAEAKSQEHTDDLYDVRVDGLNLVTLLFGTGTRIESTADGYRIVCRNSLGTGYDTFYRNGTVLVRTAGAEQLAETDRTKKWVVTVEDRLTLSKSASMSGAYYITGGTTSLYYYGNGVYRIEVGGLVSYYDQTTQSNWSTSYEWRPEDLQLTYSGCAGKESSFQGSGSGEAFHVSSLTNAPMHMWYRVTNGKSVILTAGRYTTIGTEECGFSDPSEYDSNVYPADRVRVEWSDEGGLSCEVVYNGHTVTM